MQIMTSENNEIENTIKYSIWNTQTNANKLGKKVERDETPYLRERFSEDVYMFNIAKYHEVEDYWDEEGRF
jgi:hypothetical protein